jgi:ssDNA-specific exonuclease RecJ
MALHQLTAGSNLSLLVTRGKDIVGVLRLSDVFAAVFHAMKKSESQSIRGGDRMKELEKLYDRIIQRVNINLRELEFDVNPLVGKAHSHCNR